MENIYLKFLSGKRLGRTLEELAKAVPLTAGQILVCTDSGELFADVIVDGTLTRIEIADLAALNNIVSGLTTAVQDTATGLVNLKDFIGTLPEGTTAATIVEYINAKTEGIVTDTAFAELQDAVETLTEDAKNHALKSEVQAVDAKFDDYTKTAAQEAIDAAQDAKIKAIADDYVKAADIADFETKENVKKVADNLAAMYTNEQIDNLVQGAKDYADANDADTKYGITYDSDAKKIKLVEGGTSLEIDATAFIKDGMIDTVTLDDNNDLVITFNTEAGKDAIVLPLDKLIDVYTGKATDDIIVTTDGNEISATLTETVKASLAKADVAEQNAKDYADGLNTAMDTRVKKLEDNEAGYATTGEVATAKQEAIDAAAGDATTKANAAQSAAEAKAAELDAALKTELQGEIDGDVAAAIAAEVERADAAYDAAGAAATAKQEAIDAAATAAQEKVDALANGAVKTNADNIAMLIDALTWGTF